MNIKDRCCNTAISRTRADEYLWETVNIPRGAAASPKFRKPNALSSKGEQNPDSKRNNQLPKLKNQNKPTTPAATTEDSTITSVRTFYESFKEHVLKRLAVDHEATSLFQQQLVEKIGSP